jgi:hypothetical protein
MNDKDLEAAKKYAEGELFKPTKFKQDSFEESFLAGMQYERYRQSEIVRMSFEEWWNSDFDPELYGRVSGSVAAVTNMSERCARLSEAWAKEAFMFAYAQGMKDANNNKSEGGLDVKRN